MHKVRNEKVPAVDLNFSVDQTFNRHLMLLSRRLFQVWLSVTPKIAEHEQVNATELSALVCLFEEPGLDQASLADRLGIDHSHNSALLNQLAKKDLVVRKTCDVDGRVKRTRLTPKGMAIHDRFRAKIDAGHVTILGSLSPTDRKRFLDLLLIVIETNEAQARAKHDGGCDSASISASTAVNVAKFEPATGGL